MKIRVSGKMASTLTLKALKEAKSSKTLKGRVRLAEAQAHLVELLTYKEKRMGIGFFPGERKTT